VLLEVDSGFMVRSYRRCWLCVHGGRVLEISGGCLQVHDYCRSMIEPCFFV